MSAKNTVNHGDVLILFAGLIWGVAYYFQKIAMLDIGPMLFIGFRGLIAALVLLPLAIAESKRASLSSGTLTKPPTSNSNELSVPIRIPIAIAAGVVFYIAALLQQLGLVTATVTNTGFLTAIYVVLVPFLFWFVRRDFPAAITWLAAIIAFSGVFALGGGTITTLSKGDQLVAVSSMFWALLIVVGGEAARYRRPLQYTCIQFFTVAVLGITSALLFEPVDVASIYRALPAILYVGLLSTALTFGLVTYALQFVPAPRASILLASETLFSALAGHMLLNERLNVIGWVGAVLILIAIILPNIGSLRKNKQSAQS